MRKKRIQACVLSLAVMAGTLAVLPTASPVIYADSTFVSDGFEANYDGWTNLGELAKLTAVSGVGNQNTRGMCVTNRQTPADGAYSEKGFYLDGGTTYHYSVWVYHEAAQAEDFQLSLRYLSDDGATYGTETLVRQTVKSGVWTELTATYAAPADTVNLTLSLTTDSTANFRFDDVTVTGKEKMETGSASAASAVLKDMYANHFRVGNILNSSTVNNSTITALILREYNSITCENEMKPDATMSQKNSSGTNVGVSLSSAAAILNFCAQNNIGVRGHTFVWHSQTPEWVFKENFVATNNWVSESVMNQRMESYIQNMFSAIATQYPTLNLYAYDVVNEATSDDATRTANNGGARVGGYGNGASPWVQIYGDNGFIEQAFTYAKKYAPAGCSLFYNDYNEYWDHKRNSIVTMATGLYNKGLLDGVGMQSHINANMDGFSGINSYKTAMNMYAQIGCQVQVTELDISTENGTYTLAQQAEKYQAVFQAALDCPNVTAVCVWTPCDAHTWIGSEDQPALHDASFNAKPSYTAVASLVPESDWGDGNNPVGPTGKVNTDPDENGYYFHSTYEAGTESWVGRGGATVATSSLAAYAGSQSLLVGGRASAWNGTAYPLSTAVFKPGTAYSFSGAIMQNSGAAQEMMLKLQYTDSTGTTAYASIASATVQSGAWTQLANTSYTIPTGASNLQIYFETAESLTDFYIDEAIGAVAGTVVPFQSKGSGQRGDVNNDGQLNVFDIQAAKRGMLKGFSDTAEKNRADVDGENGVNAADIQLLTDLVLRRKTTLPEIVSQVDTSAMQALFASVTPSSSYKTLGNNNPLLTQRFGADPGVMEYNGRVYVYMTNDALEYSNGTVQENSYNVQTINCISSADMVNWTDHGSIPVAGSSGAAKWANFSWAPCAAHKTINGKEKFFLYFANNAGGIGVLSADSPTGPWSDPLGKALITKSTANCDTVTWLFDPAVLVDDDGTGYLYFGGGVPDGQSANPKTARVVKLGDDMTSLAGTPVMIDAPYLFEDSGINKIGSTYYYSYCTNWSTGGNSLGITNAVIAYMTSSSPTGPFTYAGVFFNNPAAFGDAFGGGGNNHHSMVEFNGSYYLFYHARAVDKLMNLGLNYRTSQVDQVTVSGGKLQACTGTMTGTKQLSYVNPYTTVQAETINRQGGITTRGLGDTIVTDISKGDWVGVKGVAFTNGASSITVRVSSAGGGAIKICTGSEKGTAVGYVEVPSTGGSFTEITAPVSGLSGTQDLYFVFSAEMEFDSWSAK